MIRRLLSIATSISLLFTSCSNCPSKMVGTEKLLENSKTFFPYIHNQNLVFEDQSGSQLLFRIELDEKPVKNCIERLCELTADPFKSPPCEYYECETKSALITSMDQKWLLGYTVYMDLYKPETKLFYDALIASLSTENVILQGSLPLDAHFTSPAFDKSSLPIVNLMEMKATQELNGIKFNNVVVLKQSGNSLFIQQGKGIIGFSVNGNTFVLK